MTKSVNAARPVGAWILLAMAAALTACGGGGDHSSGGTTGSTTGGGTTGSTTGGVVDSRSACQKEFNPDLARSSPQDCTPVYGFFCPDVGMGSALTNDSMVFDNCPGIAISTGSVSASGLTTQYSMVRPTQIVDGAITGKADSGVAAGASGLLIILHGADSNGETAINRLRMSELAKGRNLTIVGPTAPSALPPIPGAPPVPSTWGASGASLPAGTPAARVALIDALITQVLNQQFPGAGTTKAAADVPVFIAGISGGGVLSFQYLCAHADRIEGALLVAPEIKASELKNCHPSRRVATVQVHGTMDILVSPYMPDPLGIYAGAQPTFSGLATDNGCDAAAAQTAMLPVPAADASAGISGIVVQYVHGCTSGVNTGNSLVTIQGGGHNWPGFNGPEHQSINEFGAVSQGFDATLQGFDLLRYLSP